MQTVELEEFSGRDFEDANVALDGIEFVDCSFARCTLTYSGGLPFVFTRCTFDEETMLKPEGPAAATINALWTAYHYGFRQWPEQVMALIARAPTAH